MILRHYVGAAVAVAVVASLAACGGDSQGTGEIMDDAGIESRIAVALEREYDRRHEVNCPDDGIEAGTDFTCIAKPVGLDPELTTTRIDTHLDSDGQTVEPFTPEPVPPDTGPAGSFP